MFESVLNILNEVNSRYDIINAKIDCYCETAAKQFEINCKKAELKVMKEDGTLDDYYYLSEGAAGNLIESLKNAIEKIIEAFKNFIKEIKVRILGIITNSKTKERVDKIEKKVKFNPFLSKKKVVVKDHKKIDAIMAWAKTQVHKLLSKIRSGKEILADEIPKLKEEFKKKLQEARVIGAGIKTNCGQAISVIKKKLGDLSSMVSKSDKETTKDIEDIKDAGGEKHEDAFGELEKLAAVRSEIGKEEVNEMVDEVTGDLKIVGETITKEAGNNSDTAEDTGASTEESVLSDMYKDMDPTSIFGESEADKLLLDIENDLFGESVDTDNDDFDLNVDDFE